MPFFRGGLDPHYLGNDLAGFLDDDGIADPDVLALELIGVVQGGPFHCRARELNWFEVGHWRQLARLSDLHADAHELGDGLLGLVFEGDRPARAFAARAQPFALMEIIDLHHEAVGLKIERVPLEIALQLLCVARSPARSES